MLSPVLGGYLGAIPSRDGFELVQRLTRTPPSMAWVSRHDFSA